MGDAPSAFANIIWANGITSTACYIWFPDLAAADPQAVALICFGTVVAGVIGYFIALLLHRKRSASSL